MSNTKNNEVVVALNLGFIGGMLLVFVITAFVDNSPQEIPMIEKCASVDSELDRYDSFTLYCENGFSYDRDALENENNLK